MEYLTTYDFGPAELGEICEDSVGVVEGWELSEDELDFSSSLPESSRRYFAQNNLARDFERLADQWRRDTALLSSVRAMSMHDAYQRIIGMGEPVLPLIFKSLQNQPAHWLWALKAITGEDPAKNETNLRRAIQVWLKWGLSNGYL